MNEYRPPARASSWWLGGALWLLVFTGCLLVLPERTLAPQDPAFFIAIGIIACWRWLWGGLHLVRAAYYTRVAFPHQRREAERTARRPVHVGVVVMSYGMSPTVNHAVYAALLDDLADLGAPATVVASVGTRADEAVIRGVWAEKPPSLDARLLVLLQDGTGKRRAEADALNTLRAAGLPPHIPLLLMDGDTLCPRGTLRRSIPILMEQPDVGALTVHNTVRVDGPVWVSDWYHLRMIQRHVYMSSMALSGCVLVLTGRWSLFRSELALHPNFAAAIAHDAMHHPRLGRIPMLTGEDKSTWRWIRERGYKMLYVPDVAIHPLEKLPQDSFFKSTIQLMRRWFGNMCRGGSRALSLGPSRMGFFPWLALIDQRVSMWTPLTGPVFFLTAALVHNPAFLAVYLFWVLLSRTFHSLCVGAIARSWTPMFPFHMYYGQVVGAVVKIQAYFHPATQRWTRQNTGRANGPQAAWSSGVLMVATVVLFVAAIATFSGVLSNARRWEIDTPDLTAEILRER